MTEKTSNERIMPEELLMLKITPDCFEGLKVALPAVAP